jgi:general secretion pathway protein L
MHMRLPALLTRWLDVLAALLIGWHERLRAKRSVEIRFTDGRLRVRQAGRAQEIELTDASREAAAAKAAALRARGSFVVYALPPSDVVVRRLSIPAQARDFLSGIVRNQIGQLSPWQEGQAVYGFDVEPSPEDAAILEVRVLIAARAIIEEARAELAAIGLEPDRIVGCAAGSPVSLWSRALGGSEAPARLRRVIGGAIAALILSTALTCGWAMASAAAAARESEQVMEQANALKRQMRGRRTPQALASLAPSERAWRLKEISPSALILLEALSRALPDSAYLTELTLDRAALRIVGLTTDAPSLIAPLERSGHLSDVHFFAPATRTADGRHFRFSIEARVEPHPTVGGERP